MKMLRILGLDPTPGEIGIEVELEGKGLPERSFAMWRRETDGSLRGDSCELVLREPVSRDGLDDALQAFEEALSGAEIYDTGRAGIHVHINVQELTAKELAQFICLYFVFENILLEFCGKDRVGNLFCLRGCDARELMSLIAEAFKTEKYNKFRTDMLRYGAVNCKAIATYGSLEFRAMRSTPDVGIIRTWVDMLLSIKDAALQFNSPVDIVEGMSARGTEAFFNEVLGDFAQLEFDGGAMMEGVRNAQVIAYCREDWDAPVKKFDRGFPDVVAEVDGERDFEVDPPEDEFDPMRPRFVEEPREIKPFHKWMADMNIKKPGPGRDEPGGPRRKAEAPVPVALLGLPRARDIGQNKYYEFHYKNIKRTISEKSIVNLVKRACREPVQPDSRKMLNSVIHQVLIPLFNEYGRLPGLLADINLIGALSELAVHSQLVDYDAADLLAYSTKARFLVEPEKQQEYLNKLLEKLQ